MAPVFRNELLDASGPDRNIKTRVSHQAWARARRNAIASGFPFNTFVDRVLLGSDPFPLDQGEAPGSGPSPRDAANESPNRAIE